MLEKEVFLKKNNIIFFLIVICTFIMCVPSFSEENKKQVKIKLEKYLLNSSEISSDFMQINENQIQEGRFYIKRNRMRIEYLAPSKIVFVIKENKAMYFNVDLNEVQYFNPNKTVAEFFFNLFYKKNFLDDAEIVLGKDFFSLKKNITIQDEDNLIKVFFEKSPLKLRKIELTNSQGTVSFGITNINYNPDLNDKLFSLANPLLG